MSARAAISVSDALKTFAGQDDTKVQQIAKAARHARAVDVADRIACAQFADGFRVNREDLDALKELIAFMEGELEMSAFLAPERVRPDLILVDETGERLASTYEPV